MPTRVAQAFARHAPDQTAELAFAERAFAAMQVQDSVQHPANSVASEQERYSSGPPGTRFPWKSAESAPPSRMVYARKGGDPMSPEVEFLLSVAGVVLGLILAYVAFTRTKWATS
jgi:hypothetical protein